MNAIWNVVGWQLVVATAVLGVALAASWLPRLAARTQHLVLVGGLLLAVFPARGWLEAVRLLGVDPAAWFHRPQVVVTVSVATVVAAPLVASPSLPARRMTDPRSWLVGGWMLGVAGVLSLGLRHGRSRMPGKKAVTPEERSRLDRTRAALGVHRQVSLERRADTRVPCTRGVWRPRIELPAADDLTPDELDAVLAHELGHVARHDVLCGVLVSLVRAVLWFHPLAWWAAARARHEAECACDALATAQATTIPIYLAGLAKVCRHVAGPAPLWATCVSGGGLQERMARMEREHKLLRQPRWVAGVALLALVLVPLAVASATTPPAPKPLPYTWSASVVRSADGALTCDALIVEAASGEVVMEPRIVFRGMEPATAASGSTNRPLTIEVVAVSNREAKVTFRARQGDRLLQEETVLIPIQAPDEKSPLEVRRTGEVVETTQAGFNYLQPQEQPIAAVLSPSATSKPYTWSVDLSTLPDERLLAMVEVRDAASGAVVWQPQLSFGRIGYADASSRVGDVWLHLHADGVNAKSAALDLKAVRGDTTLQEELGSFQARTATEQEALAEARPKTLYTLGLQWKVLGEGKMLCVATVRRFATSEVVMEVEHVLGRGDSATDTRQVGEHTLTFKVDGPGKPGAEVSLVVSKGDAVVERQSHTLVASADTPPPPAPPHPDGITMHLDGARLADVLKTFERITGHPVQIEAPVDAKVTVWVDDVPWQDALRQTLTQAGLTYAFDGQTIRVHEP